MNPYDLPKVRVEGAPGYDVFEGRFFMDFVSGDGRELVIVMHLWQGKWDHAIVGSKYVIHIKNEEK